METNPINLNQIIFKIRQLQIRQAETFEDYLGADVFMNELAVAHRKRELKSSTYCEITIRKRDYSESEYEKILNDKCIADLWIFEFDDLYYICLTKDIKDCLMNGKAGYVHNKYEPNGFYAIHFSTIPHLLITKEARHVESHSQLYKDT